MIIKNLGKNFFIDSSLVLLIFLLDRASKIYVIYLEKKFLGAEILTSKFLNIQLVWNEGIAFGLLSFGEKGLYNLLTIFILVIIFGILILLSQTRGLKRYFLLMILGGAIGNVFDRLHYKAVPDFIDFHYQNFHWFIFNVADIFITFGVIFMIMSEFIYNNGNKK